MARGISSDSSVCWTITNCLALPQLCVVPLSSKDKPLPIASKKHPVRDPSRPVKVQTKLYFEYMHKHAFLPESFYKKLISGEYVF